MVEDNKNEEYNDEIFGRQESIEVHRHFYLWLLGFAQGKGVKKQMVLGRFGESEP
jgi:hypothetical protein